MKHIKSGVIVTFDRWADSDKIYFHAKEMELKHFNVVLHIGEFVKEKTLSIYISGEKITEIKESNFVEL